MPIDDKDSSNDSSWDKIIPDSDINIPVDPVNEVPSEKIVEPKFLNNLHDAKAILEMQFDYKWLIKGILACLTHATLYGETGTGKTFVAVDWAMAIAGKLEKWCDKLIKTHGAVVYLAGEDFTGVVRRLRAYNTVHKNFEESDFYLYSRPEAITNPYVMREFCKELREKLDDSIVLMIVDTTDSCFGDRDGDSNQDMRMYLQGVEIIMSTLNTSVLSLMHPGHANTDRERGASNLKAAVDIRWQVTRQGEHDTVIKNQKIKNAQDGAEYVFERQVVALGHDEDGDPITSCVLSHKPDAVAEVKEKSMSGDQTGLLKDLQTLIKSDGKDAHIVFDKADLEKEKIKFTVKVVLIKDWKKFTYDRALTGREAETQKKAFDRSRNALTKYGKIKIFKNYVWIL